MTGIVNAVGLTETNNVQGGTVSTPQATVTVNSGLAFTNQVSGAAGNTGTLTNAPAVGNPAFWIPILVNGATRYIPAW